MLFDDEFVASLKDDPIGRTLEICTRTLSYLDEGHEWSQDEFNVLLEAYALLVEIIDAKMLTVSIDCPVLDNSNWQNSCQFIIRYINEIRDWCASQSSTIRAESLRFRFRTALGSGFAYEFSQGDINRVQTLLNELRDLIQRSSELDKDHQQRLLRRLEKLQSEMHKKTSDLDRFWGLIGDAGVVVGKLGSDAKPIVDRIREISEIVWQTQSRAEELPSGTRLPSLSHKSHEDSAQD